ncbi:MAG TPA: ABC transporter permease subunit [Candidatus Dormibacteraeota bacterium]|nr:ABC transporter permease subunit [Candidatus Dormibacteraeota bacterium]
MDRALARISLRQQRRGLIGFAVLGVLMTLLQSAGFTQIAGSTPAARLAFAESMKPLATQFSWLFPDPVRVDTLDGYLQWRAFSFTVVVLSLWAVFLGVNAVRGDDERRMLDMWLGAGVPRARLLVMRALSGIAALGAVTAVTCLAAVAGARSGGEAVDALGLAGIGLSLWATTCVCFGLALLLSQLMRGRRAALGLSSALVVALFLLNGFSRTIDGLRLPRLVSPFHWYDSASALAPGASYDGGAVIVLLVGAAALVALAGVALRLRDTGDGLLRARTRTRPPQVAPSRNPLLRLPVLSALFRQRWALLAWSAGVATGAVFVAGVAKPAADLLDANPQLRRLLPAVSHGASTAQLYLGWAWFGLAALLSAGFAITAVGRWASDDLEGRLAAELSAPVSRARVIVEHVAELAAELCVLALVDFVAVLVGAAAFGLQLDAGAVFVSSALLVPLGMVFGAAGGVLLALMPRGTVFTLAGVAVGSYLLFTLGPLFKLPGWALDFSVFQLYGTPLIDGLFAAGLVALLGMSAAGIAGSLLAFQRREVGG